MRILILHRKQIENRKTINDHLYSFKRYVKNVEFFYCDVLYKVPLFLRLMDWDGIIIHYSLLAERFNTNKKRHPFVGLAKTLPKMKGYKVAIPQDENAHISDLWDLIKKSKIESVYTCAMPVDYEKLYPLEKTGIKHRITTLTGFVDEETLEKIEVLSRKNKQSRDIDIGYRARNLPFWLGSHGLIKGELARVALKTANPLGLKLDISTEPKDVFYGDKWLQFILRCRTMLGCMGGASIYDPYDEIRPKVINYLKEFPKADFYEVEKACFPGLDNTLQLFAVSPRHFECAMARTCQILVEGDYQGIFKPGRNYIELKKDFSNYEEVFEKAADKKLCEQIAENTYQDIVASGKYTYRTFANDVITHIEEQRVTPKRTSTVRVKIVKILLKHHELWRDLHLFSIKVRGKLRAEARKILKKIQAIKSS